MLAGPRMEPPPSLACAAGTMPAATAAAAPPLEPPALCAGFQGLRVAPNASGSVVGSSASSGVLVRPSEIRPAALKRRVRYASSGSIQPGVAQEAHAAAVRARRPRAPPMSFIRKGTPRNGPVGQVGPRRRRRGAARAPDG